MYKLIDALTLTADHETAWLNQYGDSATYKTPFKDFSVQILWDNVTGTPDGLIELIGTIGEDNETILGSVAVDSIDNTLDTYLFNVSTVVTGVKLRYTKNSITSILLDATLSIYN